MALTSIVLALLVAGTDLPARDAGSDANRRTLEVPAEEPPAPDEVQPPVATSDVTVPRPADAPRNTDPVLVQVLIDIEADGSVSAVRVEKGAGPPWDDAVLAAATNFQFQAATQGGKPVAVQVPFVVRFMPPEVVTPDGPERTALLEGHLVEKGTGRPVPAAVLTAIVADRPYSTTSDAQGAFRVPLPPGYARVEISVPGYKDFHQVETLGKDQSIAVRYLVERQRYNPFETIVVGQRDRVEVSRTTLRGRELSRVPGAFGDPFRAILAMPGVGTVFSLFGYAIVRGTSPGNTGFLIDGVPVPQLFHYLAGPAVVHPAFIERIDFYAGGFPVRYGGYTGGIVDGITSSPPDRPQLRLQLDYIKTGAFYDNKLSDGSRLTLAGRVGYPALILSLVRPDLSASYWDYQARWQSLDGRLTAFAFGSFDRWSATSQAARDVAGSAQAGASAMFHRLDVRYRTGDSDNFEQWMVTFGYDDVSGGDNGTSVTSPTVLPRMVVERRISASLRLRAGLDVNYRSRDGNVADTSISRLLLQAWSLNTGLWADLPWKINEDLTVTPGLRVDHYLSAEALPVGSAPGVTGSVVNQITLDPRVLWRLRILPPERGETFLKGSLGMYSQPPRFPFSVPGLTEVGLSTARCTEVYALPSPCMLQSTQGSVGVERDLGEGYGVDAQVYYQWMDPIYFDFTVNDYTTGANLPSDPIDVFFDHHKGRSYGMELLLRKRDQGTFFGWLSYTLARSERLYGEVWKPYDFDRTHIVQLVGGLQLPRNWELGGRVLFQSGRPSSGPYEVLSRVDPFWRVDLRVDKRVVYDDMLFDFYVEVLNAAVVPEAITADLPLPYVLPYFGVEWILPM